MSAARGPLCGAELGEGFVDPGTQARHQMRPRSPAGAQQPTQEERELLLDLGQMVLDLTGILDPTPVSDGSNMLISIGRGDWVGAGLSGIGLIPYVGDLAKVGKLGRWAQTVHATVTLARKNARFAERVQPLLRQLAALLDQVPTSLVPKGAQQAIKRMKSQLADLLVRHTRLGRKALFDRYLQAWQGYLLRLQLPKAPPDKAVLWARLKGKEVEADLLAIADGKHTLNMALEDFGFVERYELAKHQLLEKLGHTPQAEEEIWLSFGRPVWEHISKKYTQTMSGRVTAYVSFGGPKGIDMIEGAYTARAVKLDPILFDELFFVAEAMEMNPAISSVHLVDKTSGMTKLLERSQVLRALGRTH